MPVAAHPITVSSNKCRKCQTHIYWLIRFTIYLTCSLAEILLINESALIDAHSLGT